MFSLSDMIFLFFNAFLYVKNQLYMWNSLTKNDLKYSNTTIVRDLTNRSTVRKFENWAANIYTSDNTSGPRLREFWMEYRLTTTANPNVHAIHVDQNYKWFPFEFPEPWWGRVALYMKKNLIFNLSLWPNKHVFTSNNFHPFSTRAPSIVSNAYTTQTFPSRRCSRIPQYTRSG